MRIDSHALFYKDRENGLVKQGEEGRLLQSAFSGNKGGSVIDYAGTKKASLNIRRASGEYRGRNG